MSSGIHVSWAMLERLIPNGAWLVHFCTDAGMYDTAWTLMSYDSKGMEVVLAAGPTAQACLMAYDRREAAFDWWRGQML